LERANVVTYVLLTVPHGADDAMALPVALALRGLLRKEGLSVQLLASKIYRRYGDMNREEMRGSSYRKGVREALKDGPSVLVDLHSFGREDPRFASRLMTLVWTEDRGPSESYLNLLKEAATQIGIPGKVFGLRKGASTDRVIRAGNRSFSEGPPDVLREAQEFGIGSAFAVEHHPDGDAEVYARLHAYAILRVESGLIS
jgi:hypothetical protein